MIKQILFVLGTVLYCLNKCSGQVIQFGECADVETMKFFDLENFLGKWYEIERFPTWYEDYGQCAFKSIQVCGRRIEIQHGFVRDSVQYILHVNSSYTPGDEAIFTIQENNIDPIGIPLSVITTDYTNYAIVYGCKTNSDYDIKYLLAWILSREPTLSDEIKYKAYEELNSIPFANPAYLQKVSHVETKCSYHWTAHVHAEDYTENDIEGT